MSYEVFWAGISASFPLLAQSASRNKLSTNGQVLVRLMERCLISFGVFDEGNGVCDYCTNKDIFDFKLMTCGSDNDKRRAEESSRSLRLGNLGRQAIRKCRSLLFTLVSHGAEKVTGRKCECLATLFLETCTPSALSACF